MDYIKLFQEPDGSIQKTNEYIIQSGRALPFISHNNWMYNEVVPMYISFKETIAEWLGFIQ